MLYDTVYFIKDCIIAVLIFALIAAIYKIRALKEILTQEKHKRSMPLLSLELMPDPDRGLDLLNDSYCYAKNVQISDLEVVVDYGFKKHLTLKFQPVEFMKPGARSRLNYRVFDEGYDITSTDSLNILHHFSDAPIKMQLRYENIEGAPFTAVIVPERNHYVTQDVTALQP